MTQTDDRAEMFREFHTAHLNKQTELLQQQTAALETMRSILAFLLLLVVVGVVLGAVAAFA